MFAITQIVGLTQYARVGLRAPQSYNGPAALVGGHLSQVFAF